MQVRTSRILHLAGLAAPHMRGSQHSQCRPGLQACAEASGEREQGGQGRGSNAHACAHARILSTRQLGRAALQGWVRGTCVRGDAEPRMTRRAGDSGSGRKPQRRPSWARRLRETGGAAAAVETRPRAFGADEARRARRAARRARARARATMATGARRPLRDGQLNPPRERERHGRMSRCLGALGPSQLNAAESSGSSHKAPLPSRRLLPHPQPPPPLVTARRPSSVSPLDDGRSG